MPDEPVRVAIVNDYEIVVVGIAGVLRRFPERVEVVELDSRQPVQADADIVLYDSFGQNQGAAVDVSGVLGESGGRLVVFSWNTDPEVVEQSLAAGASGYIAKSTSGEELVELIEKVYAGNRVVPVCGEQVEGGFGRWPGAEHGLSAREAEVLALVCQGLSNQEISDRAFLSLNTVKSYLRTLYQKIGVQSRTQALLWGIDHGFRPDRVRHRVTPDA